MKRKWVLIAMLALIAGIAQAEELIPNDFDGDGLTDYVSFNEDTGIWDFITGSYTSTTQYGYTAVVPVTGDFDGDGTNDFGCYNPAEGIWYLVYAADGNTTNIITFGAGNSYPVVNDFNADGITDIGTYSNGTWSLRLSTTNEESIATKEFQWGFEGSYPATGDFDGDGVMDYAAYEAQSAVWFFYTSSNETYMVKYGMADTLPVVMDVDNDGIDDYGCYFPDNGHWIVNTSSDPTNYWETMYGYIGTIPFSGQFDSDGRTDFGVYHFAGIWYTFSTKNGHTATIGTQLSGLPIGANQFNYNTITSNSLAYYNQHVVGQDSDSGQDGSETNTIAQPLSEDLEYLLRLAQDDYDNMAPPPLPGS